MSIQGNSRTLSLEVNLNTPVKHGIKVAGLLVLLGVIIVLLSNLLLPVWTDWEDDVTVRGFYEQPRDTIETIFIGTSNAKCGFSPNQLFSEWGACSYNLATEGQPIFATYYWIQEAKRMQGGSLKTVVLDPSGVFMGDQDLGYAEIALLHMQLSPIKIAAMKACEERFEDFNALEALISVFGFHSRWSSLTSNDFEDGSANNSKSYARGQFIKFEMATPSQESASTRLDTAAMAGIDWSLADRERDGFELYSYDMLAQIIDYCDAEGLNLVFVQLPRAIYNEGNTEQLNSIAESHDIPFLDLDQVSWKNLNSFDSQRDFFGSSHLNLYGSQKAMASIGEFLNDRNLLTDVSSDERYAFLRDDLRSYQQVVRDSELQLSTELNDYLTRLIDDRYITIIAAKGEASLGLTPEVRSQIRNMGLCSLADIGEHESYVGLLDGSSVYLDYLEHDVSLGCRRYFGLRAGSPVLPAASDTTKGTVPGQVVVASAGDLCGNRAFIGIDGFEYSENGPGLNFVVIDRATGGILDTSCFDTGNTTRRTTDIVLEGPLFQAS